MDEMIIEILEDGVIKIQTDSLSEKNHISADELLDLIVVFPVEDEHKFTDKDGRVLPDAHLLKRGSTAKDLAYKVHTDLGEHFIRAVDCRTQRTIGADHELKHGDVVKIHSNA